MGPREAPFGLSRLAGFPLEARTQYAFRIDRWDRDGETIMDHIAGVENLLVAMAADEAACRHCRARLRQGAKVVARKA